MKDLASEILDYFDSQISRIEHREEREELELAIQTVRNIDSSFVAIGSGILVNIIDYPIGDALELHVIIEQSADRANWERWRAIDPLVVADLRKCEQIAEEVSKRRGVNIQARVNKSRVTFYTEMHQSLAPPERTEIINVVDGFVEAWKTFMNWMRSDERKKIVAQTRI